MNNNRQYTFILIVASVCLIYVIRLFMLQVATDEWKNKGSRLTEREVIIYPSRGNILDRNGKVLVENQTVYDLMVLPKETQSFDTARFCTLVNVSVEELRDALKKAITYPNVKYKPSPVVKQILPAEYAVFAEELHKYPGFFVQARTLRTYPENLGALVLGDVGEVTKEILERNPDYRKGDYIGLNGIEKAYERELRGKRGIRYVYRDNLGIEHPVAEGRLDSAAHEGQDLIASIDAELQKYGEMLMQNKRGCIVAIEPSTGEILALVSAPTFDPNLLVGRARGDNFSKLATDPLKPLFNRATQAQYRPGSIFKIAQSMCALQLGSITPETVISCNRSLIGCHGGHSADNLEMAIVHSCNPYFRGVMQRVVEANRDPNNRNNDAAIGLGIWQQQIMKFGFGGNMGSDLPGLKLGKVPGPEYYDKRYGKGGWNYSTIYSISIGEGELLINPVQMCNLACIVANRGFYYPPHTVKRIGREGVARAEYLQRVDVGINPTYFETIVNAMEKVVGPGGTANSSKLADIVICGKTGTVQNEPKEDHSVFVCFAPKENPKIALAVYVEYAGFGGTWAGPIASLMIEKYLKGTVSNLEREKQIKEAKILNYVN
ncbi:MAG: penicillin-binding transpeptidase domain-containing protein [Bacteroidota bacterium]